MYRAGWEATEYGCRNYLEGQYDTCHYLTVWFIVPVWFRFRGYYHIVRPFEVKSADRQARLRHFAETYLGWSFPSVPPPGSDWTPMEARRAAEAALSARHPDGIPLKNQLSIRGMMVLYSFLWLTGFISFVGAFFGYAYLTMTRPMTPGDHAILLVGAVSLATFVPGLFLYRGLRKPSPEQAAIRGAVADVLGPFSDPAGWEGGFAAEVLSSFGVASRNPEAVLGEAEAIFAAGNYLDALVVARLASAMTKGGREGQAGRKRAEGLTSRCLRVRAERTSAASPQQPH